MISPLKTPLASVISIFWNVDLPNSRGFSQLSRSEAISISFWRILWSQNWAVMLGSDSSRCLVLQRSGRSWAGEKSLTLVGACFSVGLWLYCWLIKVLHTYIHIYIYIHISYIYIHTHHTHIHIYIYIRRKMQLLECSAEICHVQPLDSIGDAVPMRKQRHLKEKVSFAHRCWTSIFRTCVLKHG